MDSKESAALARVVIGEGRRKRLIQRYADGLSLNYSMPAGEAERYATPLVDDAVPQAILAVGQTWSVPEGMRVPGEEITRALRGGEVARSFTVESFTADGAVSVGGGLLLNVAWFSKMRLTAWPETHTLDDRPEPPGRPIEEPPAKVEGVEIFTPRRVYVSGNRLTPKGIPVGEFLPLLGEHYRAVNYRKPAYPPAYANILDAVAYLEENLADYRAGWPDFAEQFRSRRGGDWVGYFNEIDDGCEIDIAKAAYLGNWLWQRARSDFVREYGGAVDCYDVYIMWSPGKADVFVEAAPWADPEWEMPVDHRLAQCSGQLTIFDVIA